MSGPEFLVVYAALAIAANAGLRRYLRWRERAGRFGYLAFAQDPYRIAYLRDGAREAVRLAVFSLIDRGLLAESEGRVQRTHADATALARRPIEKSVLSYCLSQIALDSIEHRNGVQMVCQAYEDELEKFGLVAGAQMRSERFVPFFAMMVLILGAALARIQWALERGHHNIGFLIAFALIACVALTVAWRRRHTGMTDIALDRLKVLFAKLKRNAADLVPGGQSNEAVLTAAIFGLEALPAERFPYLRRLFPPHRSNGDGGGGDGGSSSSGGGGGGGGCGGGCGGGGCGG